MWDRTSEQTRLHGPKQVVAAVNGPEERDRFWREENTIIGELNRIPDSMMQKSQAEVDDYLEARRALSDGADRT